MPEIHRKHTAGVKLIIEHPTQIIISSLRRSGIIKQKIKAGSYVCLTKRSKKGSL